MGPRFSILVVCLNPGEKLKSTLESIRMQTYHDYEVIIKDGLSTDGVIEEIQKQLMENENGEGIDKDRIRIVCQKDSGIYDAMNQAVIESSGDFVYFLNCGDAFADENVLRDMAMFIAEHPMKKAVYYGNIREMQTGQVVLSNPKIDDFACYRNVPCHQACFYERGLLMAYPFKTKYKVRADYEQFLWCYFRGGAETIYADRVIADYEGGGFSETAANRKVSAKEHNEIVRQYMSRGQIFKYKFLMWITLAPLRTKIAQNEKTASIYNKLKTMLYRR